MFTSEPAGQPSPGPETKGQRTRRRILDAARRVFGQVGYDRATIRAIAAEADVDKSSVVKYFGSKESLFAEAVDWRIDIKGLTTTDPATTARNYLHTILGEWSAGEDTPMSVLLRASLTSQQAAELLRRHITAESTDQIALSLEGVRTEEARLRAALIGAVLFGIATQRHLLRFPDLADAPLDEVVRLAAPLIQALLETGDGDDV